MSSAAVVIMASEPAGQPKKLHPLFASSKTDRGQQSEGHNGGQRTDDTQEWAYPSLDEQMGRGPYFNGGSEFRPESEQHWPMPGIASHPQPAMPGPSWAPGIVYDQPAYAPGMAPYPVTDMFMTDMIMPGSMPGPTPGAMSAALPTGWMHGTMPGTMPGIMHGTMPGTMAEQYPTTMPGQMSTAPFGHFPAVPLRQMPIAPYEPMVPISQPDIPGPMPIHTTTMHGEESGRAPEATTVEASPPDQKSTVLAWKLAPTNAPSAPQPKRRGRPPKKQKTEAMPDIASHFSRRGAGQDNAQNSSREAASGMAEGGSPAARSRRIVVPYGQGDSATRVRIGVLVDAILRSKCRVFPLSESTKRTTSETTGKEQAAVSASKIADSSKKGTATAPSKSTHPFFTSAFQKVSSVNTGGSPAPAASNPTGGVSSASFHTTTPRSPPRAPFREFQPSSGSYMPQFGANNGILRVPGARFPAWPWKGVVHVRPDDIYAGPGTQGAYSLPTRSKRKGNAIEVLCDESIITGLVERLSVASVLEDIRQQSGDEFIVQRDLRLPQKHVESGRKLQARLAPRLCTNQPGVASLFATLTNRLSAFDNFGCEQLSWTQKYSPSCADDVLQSGQEPYMLKDWLEALKVVSVDTGSGDAGTSTSGNTKGGTSGKGAGRKKRKKNKLDGFIVTSDEENDDMDDDSDAEADWSASNPCGLQKQTVVRRTDLFDKTGKVHARPVNAIVISGPHGCGKSAAVYAVAKELGFEVFEINASSRRNGRDILDRIGDMTRNHLVQHRKHRPADKSEDPGTEADMEDVDGEDATPSNSEGRQATMQAFFKPKTQAAKRGRKPKVEREATPAAPAKATGLEKKQSVILLEEADVLYEEDKQFWTTVMGLIAQSKRPFVITCNDETLIPLHLLQLHGIFRFSAPPVAEAVDRLMVVAACENHVLERSAVQALYEVRGYDFRAALMDLQFWCQMAVGDQRGGFDWFVQRWPTGCDVDEEGQVKRAVSQDTYQEGMGWLRHEDTDGRVRCAAGGVDAEDELLQQAWTGWQVDVSQWPDSCRGVEAWTSSTAEGRQKRVAQLSLYEAFAEDMSDADMASCQVFASRNAVPMDATQPEMAGKTQDDYILGLSLLGQTTAAHGNDTLRLATATAMRCAAKRLLLSGMEAQAELDGGRTGGRRGWLQEAEVVASIRAQKTGRADEAAVRRVDFALAFDAIAVADGGVSSLSSSSSSAAAAVEMSVFDRSLAPIAVDVAPFVRGIVAYEGRLQKQRQRLSTFLSETPAVAGSPAGGSGADGESSDDVLSEVARRRRPKRMRTTRAALSALEGGSRRTTRKERWFQADINPVLVLGTGGDGWEAAAAQDVAEAAAAAAAATAAAAAAAAATASAAATAATASATATWTAQTDTLSLDETAWQAADGNADGHGGY